MRRLAGLAVVAGLVAGCSGAQDSWHTPSPEVFARLRDDLRRERESRQAGPWSVGVRVVLDDPRSARVVRGRGALAVAPGRGLRMILVGPAGSTMLDAWVTADAWRLAVPPADLVHAGRGDAAPPEPPLGFLRWWFVTPLGGTLFAAEARGESDVWLLRDGPAVLTVERGTCAGGDALRVSRRTSERVETVRECRRGSRPQVGDTAHYEDQATGLRAAVEVESVAGHPPDPQAFVDPDLVGPAP